MAKPGFYDLHWYWLMRDGERAYATQLDYETYYNSRGCLMVGEEFRPAKGWDLLWCRIIIAPLQSLRCSWRGLTFDQRLRVFRFGLAVIATIGGLLIGWAKLT